MTKPGCARSLPASSSTGTATFSVTAASALRECAVDRRAQDRLAVRVEPDDALIAALVRLAVDDQDVIVALARRTDVVVGGSFRAHAPHVAGRGRQPHALGEPHRLDTGVAIA
jgi:hypothetical protein